MQASALSSLSGQHSSVGDAELSIRTGREAAAMHRRMGADHTAMLTEMNTVVALIGVSDLRGALDLLDAAQSHLQRSVGGGDLSLVVADLRAEIWLRVGHPKRAQEELAAEPAGINSVRRLNRAVMRAQAAAWWGDTAQAMVLWRELHAQVPPGLPGRVRRRRLMCDPGGTAQVTAS